MKEPPASRYRNKPSAAGEAPARTLKLYCSFNGAFHLWSPYNRLRYVGGDTRVVSVYRNVTFSKLRSKIADLCPRISAEFSIKYRLPVALAENSLDRDMPLVSVVSDDDVRCMIEEYEKIEMHGKHVRLWLFVISNNNNNNNNYKKVENNELLMAKKTEKNGGLGMNCEQSLIDFDDFDEAEGNACGKVNDNLFQFRDGVVVGPSATRLLHPLIPKDGNLPPAEVHCLPRQCIHGFDHGNFNNLCDSHLVLTGGQGWLNRENVRPWSASNQSGESKYGVEAQCGGERAWGGCCQNGIRNHHRLGGANDGQNQRINPYQIRNHRNNVVEMVRGNHRNVRLDGRLPVGLRPNPNISKQGQPMRFYYPNSWKPHFLESVIERRPSAIDAVLNERNSCFSLTREQTGQSVPEHANSMSKEIVLAYCGAGAPVGYQSLTTHNVIGGLTSHARAIAAQQDILTGSPFKMPEAPLENAIDNCYGLPIDNEPPAVVQQKTISISKLPGNETAEECNENLTDSERVSSFLTCSKNGDHNLKGGVASSLDLLSYLSLSSSKEMESAVLSALAINDIANSSVKPVPNTLDLMDEEQLNTSHRADKSNGVASNSQDAVNMEKDPADEEEIQLDPPSRLIIDGKAETKESNKCSKLIKGVSTDLAAFYTHLAAHELQNINDSDLEYIKELGSGAYGTVYYGKWKGSDVAIKKIKPSCFTGGSLEEDKLVADFWKEAYILGQLHHPNIVAFYGVVTDGPVRNLATVTEYMVNGSLKQVLRRKDRTIDRRKRLILAMDAAFGMEYLHSKSIVHFDLKSHNFFVNMRDPQRPVCKIGDMGLSKIRQRTLVSGGVRGTIPWMAPELLNSKNNMVTEKVDVYSFGVVMWELLTGEEPYANLRSNELIDGIINGILRPEIPSWCDPTWRSLMVQCWSSDPASRPTFSEIAKELRAMAAAINIK